MAANVKITKRAGINDDLLTRLRAKHLDNAKEILARTDLELVTELDECFDVVQYLQKAVSKFTLPKKRTVRPQNFKSARIATVGLKALDDFLHGGISVGSITEIVGPAGSGKTQFCHMMCCLATLPKEQGGVGPDATVLYLDTEGAFAPNRLAEILASHELPLDSIGHCVNRIRKIGRIGSIEEFETILRDMEVTIASNDVKLVVVDSIAALVRKDYDLSSIPLRQAKLANIASQLKRLAEAFQIPVIIVNQVTTQIASDSIGSDKSFVTAALGTAWSHSVNTRLVLEPTNGRAEFGLTSAADLNGISLRRLTLAKSPTAPVVMMAVHIWAGGLQLVLNPSYSNESAAEEDDEDIFEKYMIAMDPANFWTHGIASSTTK